MKHTLPRNTYYLKYRAIVFIFTGTIIAFEAVHLIVSILLGYLIPSGLIDIPVILLLGIMISLYQTRIVTSPSGISYHNSGLYSIHSIWENVESINRIRFRGLGQQRCIVMKKGKQLGWWTGIAFAVTNQERGRTIPIPERNSWDKFEHLREDIRKYSPDVKGLDLI